MGLRQPARWRAIGWRRRSRLVRDARPRIDEVEGVLDYCDWYQATRGFGEVTYSVIGALAGGILVGLVLDDAWSGIILTNVTIFVVGILVVRPLVWRPRVAALRERAEHTRRYEGGQVDPSR